MKSTYAFGLMVLSILPAACSKSGADAQPKGAPKVPVVTAPVERRSMSVSLTAAGSVESTGSVTVQTRVDGQIIKVFVRDGSEVRAGQPLLQIDPKPFDIQLRLERASLAANEARLGNLRAKEERGRALLAQHFISADDYRQLKTDFDAAAAAVDQSRATVDNAQLQLEYATVRAPVAGKIGHIAQQVGNTVRAASGTPLTTLNVLDTVDVSFAVPEHYIGAVHAAFVDKTPPAVQIVGAANPMAGKLSFIDNAADPTTGTIRLRARFDNRQRQLWPGQFVTVSLQLAGETDAIVVPSEAVGTGPKGSYVYVIEQETAEQRPIQVLRDTGTLAIVSGVQAGEQVVVDGQSRLKPGSKVNLHSDASNPRPAK